MRFALATSRRIDEAFRSALSARDIELLSEIQSGADLADRLLQWSAVNELARRRTQGSPTQLKMTLRIESNAMPLAARTDSLIKYEGRPSTTLKDRPGLTNDEVFLGVFGKLALSKKGPEWRTRLSDFFVQSELGMFGDRPDFLRFLEETVREHKYKSPEIFSQENLRIWFRELNSGALRGSKL